MVGANRNPANWVIENTVLSHRIEVEIWLLTSQKRKEDAVALSCKCWLLNALDFIKHCFLVWVILWAHQPPGRYVHVVKYCQRVGVSGNRTAVRIY